LKSVLAYENGDDDMQAMLQEQTFNEFLACCYLDNIDSTKYGSVMTGLSTHWSLGTNQYPKTITETNDVLSSHRFDIISKSKMPYTNNNESIQKKII
jgi:hypothetical protein